MEITANSSSKSGSYSNDGCTARKECSNDPQARVLLSKVCPAVGMAKSRGTRDGRRLHNSSRACSESSRHVVDNAASAGASHKPGLPKESGPTVRCETTWRRTLCGIDNRGAMYAAG